jgi:hypothetical protein
MSSYLIPFTRPRAMAVPSCTVVVPTPTRTQPQARAAGRLPAPVEEKEYPDAWIKSELARIQKLQHDLEVKAEVERVLELAGLRPLSKYHDDPAVDAEIKAVLAVGQAEEEPPND